MTQWIAGITRGHNGATVLLKDGEVVFYLEEERLSRKKYDGGPFAGMLKIKEYTDKIDYLVVAHTQPLEASGRIDFTGDDMYTGFARKIGLIDQNPKYKLNQPKIHPQVIDMGLLHHEMHAACAFYNSGFEEAACVIVDGAGTFVPLGDDSIGWELETIFHASYPNDFVTKYKHIGLRGPQTTFEKIQVPHAFRGKPDDLHDVIFSDRPGITKCYEAMTNYCGFPFIEAGKAMGLAPYGKENPNIPFIFHGEEGRHLSNRNLFVPNYPNGAHIDAMGFPYLNTDNLEVRKDLAYAVQKATQEQVLRLIKKAIEVTGSKNVVLAGGFGLNCVANYYYLSQLPEGVKIYNEPISHDGGTSIGAAKYVHHEITKDRTIRKQNSIYYGPNYFETTGYNINLDESDGESMRDITKDEIIDLIREKNIVALYQGGSEAGPRALGNRTLMFDPTVENGKDLVNEVKHREWFRPFAGTVLAEHVHEYFDLRGMEDTPFMMYAVNCQPGVEKIIPSIIHVDGTCRIQTVTKEQNKHYYELIEKFHEKTGVPILFNTSFNLGGDPLVETIDDAIDTLRRSDIEYLYLPEIDQLVHIPKNSTEEEDPILGE
jgi:carbamoyltransferase